MTAFKAANVTKYDAPGGDNVVADGYIKTVEKIWMDSFAFTAVITTADTIDIAYIPPNKKITSVDVYLDFVMAPTNTTIQVGIPGSTSYFIESAGTVGLSAVGALVGTKCISSATNRAGKLAGGYVTTGSTTTAIRMQLGVTAMTSPTAGTIRTIVRYT